MFDRIVDAVMKLVRGQIREESEEKRDVVVEIEKIRVHIKRGSREKSDSTGLIEPAALEPLKLPPPSE